MPDGRASASLRGQGRRVRPPPVQSPAHPASAPVVDRHDSITRSPEPGGFGTTWSRPHAANRRHWIVRSGQAMSCRDTVQGQLRRAPGHARLPPCSGGAVALFRMRPPAQHKRESCRTYADRHAPSGACSGGSCSSSSMMRAATAGRYRYHCCTAELAGLSWRSLIIERRLTDPRRVRPLQPASERPGAH